MKARNLLGGASFGPEKLKDIYQAFDDAWAAISPVVDNTPLAQEAARIKLANLILSVAKDENGGPPVRHQSSPPEE
jgi:hypothetical protein